MKREQNNGQKEGKVLINSSTSLVLALGCVALHYPGNGFGGCGSIIGGNALSAIQPGSGGGSCRS